MVMQKITPNAIITFYSQDAYKKYINKENLQRDTQIKNKDLISYEEFVNDKGQLIRIK